MTARSTLAGKRVVNTRALSQAGELDRLLAEHGAIPVSFPCIAIRPPADVGAFDAAVGQVIDGGFDWVLFTSVNTIEAVAARLADLHKHETDRLRRGALLRLPGSASHTADGGRQDRRPDPRRRHPEQSDIAAPVDHVGPRDREPQRDSPTGTSTTNVAVVGPVTAETVMRLLGWPVSFVPEIETAAELGQTVPISPGDRVLLPKSAIAGPALAAILSGRGADVTEVVAYETVTGAGGVDLASLLAAGEVDAVCFTSGSTVRGCLERLGGAAGLDAVRVACIGTETALVARSRGLRVDVVPVAPTVGAMVEALAASFRMTDGCSGRHEGQ